MSDRLLVSKVVKYIAIVIVFGLGVLGFARIIPMQIVIPISIVMFFVGVTSEACEMFFNKNRKKLSTVLYLIRLSLIIFCCIVIAIVIIRKYIF